MKLNALRYNKSTTTFFHVNYMGGNIILNGFNYCINLIYKLQFFWEIQSYCRLKSFQMWLTNTKKWIMILKMIFVLHVTRITISVMWCHQNANYKILLREFYFIIALPKLLKYNCILCIYLELIIYVIKQFLK